VNKGMKFLLALSLFFYIIPMAFSASIEKNAKRIVKEEFEEVWSSLADDVPKAKDQYAKVKDTMEPEEQKMCADEYGTLLLLKGYVGLKLGKPEAEEDLKFLTVFFDTYSSDQYLCKAYAWKLLLTINESRGDFGQIEYCRKKMAEETENYKALGEASDTKNILDGILGGLF
jgi:ABC-type transporter MlaC component